MTTLYKMIDISFRYTNGKFKDGKINAIKNDDVLIHKTFNDENEFWKQLGDIKDEHLFPKKLDYVRDILKNGERKK